MCKKIRKDILELQSRLFEILYIFWELKNEKVDFNIFYQDTMNNIINAIEEKIRRKGE